MQPTQIHISSARSSRGLEHKLRVSQERAGHRDHVGFARSDNPFRIIRCIYSAAYYNRHAVITQGFVAAGPAYDVGVRPPAVLLPFVHEAELSYSTVFRTRTLPAKTVFDFVSILDSGTFLEW